MSELVARSAPPIVQRVQCGDCKVHRMTPGTVCGSCGSRQSVAVRPGVQDLIEMQREIQQAGEAIDHLLQAGHTISKSDPSAERLRQACRAYAFAQAGVMVR